ncbi:HTH domain-containing protein [Candidatus Woesearchaeota archaeon]|nr:HTH domain-containing protein [Candidatus Woesearchaeota archaeon]
MNNKELKSIEVEKLVEDMVRDRIPNNATILLNLESLAEIFTRKRMQLIKTIEKNNPKSIQELAEKVNRKKQAVHRDLKLLEGHGLVELIKDGSKVIPIVSKEIIHIPLAHKKINKISDMNKFLTKNKEEIIDAEIYVDKVNINEIMKGIA